MKSDKKRKIYLISLIAISFALLLPLLRIAFYDHPSADDYGYSSGTYHVYTQTHSISEVLKEAFRITVRMRNSWQGLYTSTFIQTLQPAIFGVKYYALTAFLILGSIWISTIVFSYYVLCVRCKCDKLRTMAVTCVMCTVMTQFMPSAVEGMYWFNGAVNYTLNYGIIVLLLTLCISFSGGASTVGYVFQIIGASILAFLLSGVNYVPAFEGLMLEVIFLIVCILIKNKRGIIGASITFLFGMLGFYINISSPGVRVRQDKYIGMSPFTAIFEAVKQGFELISGYWGVITLFFIVLTIPSMIILARTVLKNTKITFPKPLLVFFVSFMFLCAMITPPLYAMGFYDEGRVLDMVFISAVFVAFFDVFYFIGWWEHTHGACENSLLGETRMSKWESAVSVVIIIAISVGCLLNSWAYKATVSLVSGEAKEYEGEMYYRYQLLTDADEEVVLPVIRTKPEMLFFNEIADAPDLWPNTDLESYFDVDKVYLETYFN